MVDPAWLANVKKTDKHPLIKAFTVAHEGDSDIVLDGIRTPVKWLKNTIRWIKDKLDLHTPVFERHGPPGDNSHEGRTPIGEIVGKKLMEVGSKVATVAAMYIKPEFHNLPLDVASIEADIMYSREGNTIWPIGIEKISGVALAHSSLSKPGFPEATILGSIAAFADTLEKPMTKDEIKAIVITEGIKPEELFSAADLISTTEVREHVKTEKADTYNHAKRVEAERDLLRDENVKIKDELEGKIKSLTISNLLSRTATVFDSIATERNLDSKEKDYISLQLDKFNSETTEEAIFKTELNKYVDVSLVNFESVKTILGVESKQGNTDDNDNTTKPNQDTPPSDLQHIGDRADMPYGGDNMDPDKNPLISGGKADLEYNKGK